ncbi:MAG: mreD [Parachlamydiaceae bacterium]
MGKKPFLYVSVNGELFLFFLAALIFTLFGPIFASTYKIFYFIPLLIRSFYLKTFEESLWISCLCGFLLDLLSSHVRFGFHAFSYTITSALLYSQTRNFFEDSLSTLPVLTYFYALLLTIIQAVLLIILEKGTLLSWEFVKIDLVFLPFQDALYSFTCFSIPKLIFGQPIKKGKDYFY